jgi:hypothetical protein
MTAEDKDKIGKLASEEDEGESGGSSGADTGSVSGAVEFHDFLAPGSTRDNVLPPQEKKRLFIVHKEGHESRVKKQKELRELRKALKEGRIRPDQYQQGLRDKGLPFKSHRILAFAAQFSGIDNKVNPLPTENNNDDANQNEKQQKLQYQPRFRQENVPRFNPKPKPH